MISVVLPGAILSDLLAERLTVRAAFLFALDTALLLEWISLVEYAL